MTTGRPGATFRHRRRRLLRQLDAGVTVVPTAPVATYSNDVKHPFRPDSDFYYLTGFDEPEAVAVLLPGSRRGAYRLFVRPRAPEREVWDGPRAGLEGACRRFGASSSHAIEELETELERLLRRAPVVHYRFGRNPGVDRAMRRVLRRVRRRRRRGPEVRDPAPAVHAMRAVKHHTELRLMARAARITCAAHRAAMAAVAPGLHEYDIQAVIEYEFRRRGAAGPAYPSIVGSGPNACVLHHIDNRRRMRAGDLLLVDAGCEVECYSSDVTRTFPVSGHFTAAQREVYDLVLAAQQAAIGEVGPGASFDAPHRAAVGVLADGLAYLGVLSGSAAEIIETESYRRFFMHRTSHWLGMDVHDVGPCAQKGARAPRLRSGMVLTVEPGLYIAPADRGVPARYRGIGIRIEDDVAVTGAGHRVLSDGVPKTAHALERLVGSAARRT